MRGKRSTSHSDGWGEAVYVEADPAPIRQRRFSRWWVLAAAGLLVVVLGGIAGYYAVRRAAIKSLSQSCHDAYRAGDWEKLEASASRWLAWEKGNLAAVLYLAQAMCETSRFERAVELLDNLPESDPDTPKALVEKSAILFEALNRPIDGAKALEEALRLDPQIPEARRRLVYFYAYTLQRRKLVQQVQEAIQNECDLPETFIYLIARDWLSFGDAHSQNAKWLAGSPDEELFLVARSLFLVRTRAAVEDETPDLKREKTREEDTVAYHRKLLAKLFERFPNNVELRAYYVEQAVEKSDVEDVARLLAAAPPEAVDDNRFWRYTGWLHAARGDWEQAETCCRKAIALNPYDHTARFQLAGVERRARRLDEVKRLEDLWRRGKQLRMDILQLERVDKAPLSLMRRVTDYAKDCGDEVVAGRLEIRFQQTKQAAGKAR